MGTLRRKAGREIWTAIYRDGDGIKHEVSTECKSKDAAKQVLADLERDKERIISGVVSRQEARTAEWAAVPLAEQITAHLESLRGLQRSERTIEHRKWLLNAVSDGCRWKRLSDLSRPQLERWLTVKVSEGMGARTRNCHAGAAVAFSNWLVRAGRLTVNPFSAMPMLNEKADRRRERRVLTLEEFGKLIDAAERRPLSDRSKNRGADAELKPATVDKLLWLGRTRAMIYRVLMFTGLRYGELRSITLGQLCLSDKVPHIELKAANEKARRGAQVPLPEELAKELDTYVAERRKRIMVYPSNSITPFPGTWETAPLFDMPEKMTKVFDADLKEAEIVKKDAQGRTLDIHALRHSFCTLVAQSGVNMQTAQRLMRHSTPAMTAKYTHLTLTDLGDAMATLPKLPGFSQHAIAAVENAPNLRPTQRPTNPRISVPQRATSCTFGTQNKGARSKVKSAINPNVSGGSQGVLNGGRCKIRTCDPLRVKQVL